MFLFVSTYLLCPYPFIPPTSLYSSYIPVSLLISDSLLHSCTPLSPCILNIRPVSLYPLYIIVYLLHFCIQSFISVFLLCPFCIPISNHSSLYYSIYLYPRIPPVSLYPILHPCIHLSTCTPLYPFVSLLYPCISLVSLYPILHPCIPLSTCTPLYPSCIPVSNPSSLY